MWSMLEAYPGLAGLSRELERNGKWQAWSAREEKLAGFASLDEAAAAWQNRAGAGVCCDAVAALVALGSARGGDDHEAALAVLALLRDGIEHLAAQMRRGGITVCSKGGPSERVLRRTVEPGDVVTAVYEVVKAAEPDIGRSAPKRILQRARQRRLLAPSHAPEPRRWGVGAAEEPAVYFLEGTDHDWQDQVRSPQAAGRANPAEQSCAELADLLEWGVAAGVIEPEDVALVTELCAAWEETGHWEARDRVVAERHGVGPRTVRRRHAEVVARLREAAPAYLAAVS